MSLSEQIKTKKLRYFLLSLLPVSLIHLAVSGCGNSLNQENYLACQLKLEADRQKARAGEAYSYKSLSFEECRSPVLYRVAEE